jgi:hypothetical protein
MTVARDPGEGPTEGELNPVGPFARAGLELIDLDASDAEIAVIEAVDGLYRPLIEGLLQAELDAIDPEPGTDLSSAPAPPG